ncbi:MULTISPECIES: hypothetical protein [unclassified Microbacterium]|nr:hypothetical protein [Microbacterium sp. ABRD28]
MTGKTPRSTNVKKEPKLTLKEKREVKRAKVAAESVKPRKSR